MNTCLIDVVLTLGNVLGVEDGSNVMLLAYCAEAFGKNNNFVPRNVKLLNCFADYDFTLSVTVNIGGIPGLESEYH